MPSISRRRLLTVGGGAAGAAIVAGAGVAGWVSTSPRQRRPSPQVQKRADALQSALNREQALLDQLAAGAAAHPALAAKIEVLRTDHAAHAEALAALIRAAGVVPTSADPVSSSAEPGSAAPATPTPPPASVASLVQLELSNQRAAAVTSAGLTGSAAAVLASISACEATHAAWLR